MSDADEPRPSATVLVARQRGDDAEVLLVERHAGTAFGAVHAFPGGVLEPADANVATHCRGIDDARASETLSVDRGGLAYYSAAIRELFEEVGILLGDCDDADALPALRDALNGGDIAWSSALEQHAITLHCDALDYFAHWVTPVGEPKRFSTRFFAALAPAGQEAVHDCREITDCCWVTPATALAAYERKELGLIYPTWRTLEDIRDLGTADAIVAWARARSEEGVPGQKPAIVHVDGKPEIVFPDDDLYPEEQKA